MLEMIEFQTMSKMVGEVESLVAALHSSLLNTDRELQELGAEEEVLEAWHKTQQGIMVSCCTRKQSGQWVDIIDHNIDHLQNLPQITVLTKLLDY